MLGGKRQGKTRRESKGTNLFYSDLQIMRLCTCNEYKRYFGALNPCKHTDPEQYSVENLNSPCRPEDAEHRIVSTIAI